ncbi:hypothetical protein B0H19DRAFT_1263552 [Mycena capillaripes]|nr:hypothetical protein B0H19DRAFT_1263552 [Mycena capillaripes]
MEDLLFGALAPMVNVQTIISGLCYRAQPRPHLSSRDWANIWMMIRNTPIRLQHLSTDIVNADLLAYLASYSGLKTLLLQNHDEGTSMRDRLNDVANVFFGPVYTRHKNEILNSVGAYVERETLFRQNHPEGTRKRDESNHLADLFFASVLPRHAETLLVLSCPVGFPGRWCFGAHNADVVRRLDRVISLDMSVVGRNDAVRGSLILSPKPQYEWAIQTLLLQCAPLLSALRSLVISCPRVNPDFGPMHAANEAAVQSFRSHIASPAIVLAAHEFYQLNRVPEVPDSGKLGYHNIPDPKKPGFKALLDYRLNRR